VTDRVSGPIFVVNWCDGLQAASATQTPSQVLRERMAPPKLGDGNVRFDNAWCADRAKGWTRKLILLVHVRSNQALDPWPPRLVGACRSRSVAPCTGRGRGNTGASPCVKSMPSRQAQKQLAQIMARNLFARFAPRRLSDEGRQRTVRNFSARQRSEVGPKERGDRPALMTISADDDIQCSRGNKLATISQEPRSTMTFAEVQAR